MRAQAGLAIVFAAGGDGIGFTSIAVFTLLI
jgi:hypothetical protein